jgi:hypothetical protein
MRTFFGPLRAIGNIPCPKSLHLPRLEAPMEKICFLGKGISHCMEPIVEGGANLIWNQLLKGVGLQGGANPNPTIIFLIIWNISLE